MKNRRISALMLTAAILASAVITASCGDSDTKAPSGNDVTTGAETVDPYEGWLLDDLPSDLKFDGETFTIFFGHPLDNYIMEEETGDPVDDAVYKRNAAVQERFGIKLVMEKCAYDSGGGDQQLATEQISANILA